MKKLFFPIAFIAIFSIILTSCGSKGFTDEQRKQFKDLCMVAKTMGMEEGCGTGAAETPKTDEPTTAETDSAK